MADFKNKITSVSSRKRASVFYRNNITYCKRFFLIFLQISQCDWLQSLDPFAIDNPKIKELLQPETHENSTHIFGTINSIWTTREDYVQQFIPASLALFHDQYLTSEALNKLKNQKRASQIILNGNY